MSYRNFSAQQLQAIDAAHHLHPFTDHKELRAAGTRVVTHAKGPFIHDAAGNEILDGMAGLWCVNVGYGREELVEVAAEQMRELPYYNAFFKTTTPAAALLADKIAGLAPGNMNQVIFASSGSEGNDTALKMVRHYWALEGRPEKNVIISRHMAYHGSTIAGTSLGGMPWMHNQTHGLVPGIRHVMPPYAFELQEKGESEEEFGRRAARAVEEAILAEGPENVAAFIAEPIMGAGGVKIPPKNYWPEVQRILKKHDVLLMLDEVITGYGRTGQWFAAQSMGIEADTITTAKALTSGYLPLSAVLVGDRVAATLIDKGGEFFHGYTYSGHPVACAVGLKNLEIIEAEGLIERVRARTGPYLAAALKKAVGEHPLVGEVRTFGFLAGIEIVKDRDTRERFLPSGSAAVTVRDHAIARGLMIRATGDTMILSPPLIWEEQHIDMAAARLKAALDAAANDLGVAT